ncbi:hypothetical protein JCM19046_3533 [Bacillus sp. JCM 19046]|nr:hypothetical protein JCM19045_4241 [Bacillus sp. JCM 19045]GAF18921.1 hypothetical protein JCM19046_3533 [Bacillus sp. JCM 19046]
MNRKEERAQRLKLLGEIDHITENHCEPCPNTLEHGTGLCEGCEWFKELGAKGEQLEDLSNKRKDQFKDVEWFPSLYNIRKLKESNYTSKEIAKFFGMKRPTYFRKRNEWLKEEAVKKQEV